MDKIEKTILGEIHNHQTGVILQILGLGGQEAGDGRTSIYKCQ